MTPPPPLLRPPRPDDADAMARLDRAGLPEFMTRDPALAPLVEMQLRSRASAWAAAFPRARTRVAEAGGRAAGRLVDEAGPDAILVIEVVVDPDFRRRGLAAAMLRAVQAEAARTGRAVAAHIYPDNAASLALFAACGFALDHPPAETQAEARWTPPS